MIKNEFFFNYFKKYTLCYPKSFFKSFCFVLTLTFFNVLIPIGLRSYLQFLEANKDISVIIIGIIGFALFLLVSTYINITLGVILLIASCLGFLISMLSRKTILKSSRLVNEAMKVNNETQNELIDSIELIKTWNLESYFLNKTSESFVDFIDTSNKVDKKQVFLKNLINDFHFIISIGILSFLTLKSGWNTSANFAFYIFVSDLVISKSQEIEGLINSLLKTLPSFEDVNNILNLEVEQNPHKIDRIKSISFDEKLTKRMLIK